MTARDMSPPGWLTHVRVDDVGESLARAERAGGKRLGPADDGSEGVAVLADPAGVPFCLRQAGENDGVELADEPNCWAMTSLHTADVGQAQAFYGAMFGWELQAVPGAPFSLWLRSQGPARRHRRGQCSHRLKRAAGARVLTDPLDGAPPR